MQYSEPKLEAVGTSENRWTNYWAVRAENVSGAELNNFLGPIPRDATIHRTSHTLNDDGTFAVEVGYVTTVPNEMRLAVCPVCEKMKPEFSGVCRECSKLPEKQMTTKYFCPTCKGQVELDAVCCPVCKQRLLGSDYYDGWSE